MRVAGFCASAVLFLASTLSFAAQEAAEYILGPEDVITVTVLRHPEFSGDFLVPRSGIVQLPALGNVVVGGWSLDNLSEAIKQRLKARLRRPEVSVTLKAARIQRIYLLGDVKSPGMVDLKPNWKVAEGLSAAGGLVPGTQLSDVRVTLQRPGKPSVVSSLEEALSTKAEDFYIRSGDVLRFDSIAMIPVYVSGSVKAPGLIRLRSDGRGILAAIAQAGGVLPDAAPSSVKVVKLTGTEQTLDLSPFFAKRLVPGRSDGPLANSLPVLEAGDMVLVPESRSRIAVLGFVNKPGYYNLQDGQFYSLADAIALASGGEGVLNFRGRIAKVGIIRHQGDKDLHIICDLGKFLKAGLVTENPMILPGDVIYVPESNRVELSTVLSGISSAGVLLNSIKR
jgi:polysaccharide export outer membrane protein